MSLHDEEPLPPGVPEVTHAVTPPLLRRPPFWSVAILLALTVASWVPLALFARARTRQSPLPRVHLVQDMGDQPKLTEQQSSELFADGRADRPRPAGTVARGKAEIDDHLYRGYSLAGAGGDAAKPQVKFFDDFPGDVPITAELVRRGRERYDIYCAACHGLDGYGNGPVNQRAQDLVNANQPGMAWTQPSSLHADAVRARPNGHLYNTIVNGIRNMPAYGGQVQSPRDRWAIVAYVRALQVSQHAPPATAEAGSGFAPASAAAR